MPSAAADRSPETNWAGNLTYRAARVHRPTSVAEVQEIVAGSHRVKVLGSRHCFNDIADTAGDLVVLADLVDVAPVFDPAAADGTGVVWVPGGMPYSELVLQLASRGAALANLASLPHITVVGATATGTHGSGNRTGSLSTSVVGLEFVRSDGELVSLSPADDDFAGAVVHLGALGVVTRIGLRYEPGFAVRNTVYLDLPWERFFAELDAVAAAAYSVSVFTDWHALTQVWVKSRTDEPVAPGDFFGARAATVPTHMLRDMPVENLTEQLGVPGEWHERLPHFRAGFTPSRGYELQSEYFVPRCHGRAACEALRPLAAQISPLLQVSEIRTVAADDLWLSPASGVDVLALHFTWLPDEARVRAVLPRIEEALRPYAARPHWGKLFTTDADELAALYPRTADFRRLVRRFDPRGAFRNDYLDRTIAGHG